jgi:uncharacterized protein (DUF1800 family)
MREILGTLWLGLTVSSLVVGQLPAADRALEKTAPPVARQPAGWNQPLNSDAKILQLLNRITFGPRPGDVERVRQTGITTFLQQQLHPESLNDSTAEAKVASLPTLSMSSKVLAENFQEMIAERRAQQQEKPDTFAPPGRSSSAAQGSPTVQALHPARKITQGEMQGASQDKAEMLGPRRAVVELAQEELLRAVYSNRQLQEEMVQFWMNHFNIFADKDAERWLITSFERDTIRPRALGKFEDLLVATAESPAMLFYLDNWLSGKPDGAGKGRQPGGGAMHLPRPWGLFGSGTAGSLAQSQSQPANSPRTNAVRGSQPAVPVKAKPTANNHGLNENYARELMELHTLGVDGGYTQSDVIEVARCLTGWTINRPRQGGEFLFNPRMHDTGAKVVLGHKIRAGKGMEDGLAVLHILAHHPSTAHFIALKLCRRFVADDPPPSVVENASRAFRRSDGDLRVVLKTILSSPEFYSQAAYRAKVKSPLELAASSMRALGADTDAGYPLIQMIARMGQPMFEYQAPTGFPDRAATWINSGTLLTRMNFALAFASNRFSGTTVDWTPLEPGSGDFSPEAELEKLNQQLLQGSLTNQTRESILKQFRDPMGRAAYQGDGQSSGGALRQSVRNTSLDTDRAGVGKSGELPAMTALALASPEFQRK